MERIGRDSANDSVDRSRDLDVEAVGVGFEGADLGAGIGGGGGEVRTGAVLLNGLKEYGSNDNGCCSSHCCSAERLYLDEEVVAAL